MHQAALDQIQVVFVVPPQVHLLDITGPIHIFYEAVSYGAPISLLYTNLQTSQQHIESSSHLLLGGMVDYTTLVLKAGDIIFVPGLVANLLLDEQFLSSATKPF